MAEQRHFIVLGLGTFGEALTRRLTKNGCSVTGVDNRQERVDALKDILFAGIIGDATDYETLKQLPMKTVQAVIIGMGEDIAPSMLATLHAKELGARRIIVKGVTVDHGKILKQLGVERVVFPETEIAEQLADHLTWPNIVDFLPIGSEDAFVEISLPDSYAGKTLRDADLRHRYGVWVVGVKDAMTGELTMFPDGEYVLGADQLLLVVGNRDDIDKMREAFGKVEGGK